MTSSRFTDTAVGLELEGCGRRTGSDSWAVGRCCGNDAEEGEPSTGEVPGS
jgi:hypothetical protein